MKIFTGRIVGNFKMYGIGEFLPDPIFSMPSNENYIPEFKWFFGYKVKMPTYIHLNFCEFEWLPKDNS